MRHRTAFRRTHLLQCLCSALLLGLAGGQACGAGEDLGPGDFGTLRISTTTTGGSRDPDGYVAAVDGIVDATLGAADTVLRAGLAPGRHEVGLTGTASNCSVQGANPRTVTVIADVRTDVRFDVECLPPEAERGMVEVAVTTGGVDLDADGYMALVDPGHAAPLSANGFVQFTDVVVGSTQVRIGGLAGNCTVAGSNPREVLVAPGAILRVEFTVTCWPPLTGRIAFSRGRVEDEFRTVELIRADQLDELDFVSELRASLPVWSPDRQRIAYFNNSDVVASTFISLAGFDVEQEELVDCWPPGPVPVWSPDGNRLLCRSNSFEDSLYTQPISGADGERLAPSLSSFQGTAWSASGGIALIAALDRVTGLFLVKPDGTGLTRLAGVDSGIFENTPAWSPDGSRLAYVDVDPGTGNEELSVIEVATGSRSTLTEAEDIAGPRWAPDGDAILFTSFTNAGPSILLVGLQGAPAVRLAGGETPTWSPDGSKIAFSLTRPDQTSNLYAMNRDGSGLVQLTTGLSRDTEPAWAP